MSEQHHFTVKEFNTQVCEFRKLFGDKTFWAKPAKERKVAIDALGMAYMFLHPDTPTNEVEDCAGVWQATVGEYQQRELMLIRLGKVKDVA